jgi:hypothetical protein
MYIRFYINKILLTMLMFSVLLHLCKCQRYLNDNIIIVKNVISSEAMSDKNEFPVRIINLLDHHEYCDNKRNGKSYNRSVLKKEDINSIPILQFTVQSVVACLDVLYLERIFKKKKNNANYILRSPELHFVFMGDSRIKQQFIYFLRVRNNFNFSFS